MSKRFATNPDAPKKNKGAKKSSSAPATENPVATPEEGVVTSGASTESAPTGAPTPDADADAQQPVATGRSMKAMELVLVRNDSDRKSKRLVNYKIEGRTGSVQFLSTLFGGTQTDRGNPPERLTLTGEFAEPKVKVAKAKETPEERKARLAAMPKLTLEQKVAKAEEKAAKLREKLAKKASAGQNPPPAAPPAEGEQPQA